MNLSSAAVSTDEDHCAASGTAGRPDSGCELEIQDQPERYSARGPPDRGCGQARGIPSRQGQSQSSQNLPALRIGEIIVTDFDDRGLFILNDEGQTIWWREAPGEERPGEPKAGEKWEMLRKWGESSKKRALPERDYWKFSATELVPGLLA